MLRKKCVVLGANVVDLERWSAAQTFIRTGGGERWEIGRIRQVDRQAANAVEALIPREVTIPEGSGDRRRGRPNRVVEVQRATGSEAAATGANRHAVVEPKGRTGTTSVLGRKRSSRLGALTPDMEVAERRQPVWASKKPLLATGSGQEAASGELGSIDPGAGENGHRGAEQRIVRRFCLQSSMPCMPVVSHAGNQVTWNHFFYGAQNPALRRAGCLTVLGTATRHHAISLGRVQSTAHGDF